MTLSRQVLETMYVEQKLSMAEIAVHLGCSIHKVEYWMNKHSLKRRSISDAIYAKANPNGDPFSMTDIDTTEKALLLGLGVGLYWGEGNKRSRHSVRLGNTDPALIKQFIRFLIQICGIDPSKLRYGLQIFSDTAPTDALKFWMDQLNEPADKFTKVTVTPSRGIGTYRYKNRYGVLTVSFHNYKLRDIIVGLCRDSSVGRAHLW